MNKKIISEIVNKCQEENSCEVEICYDEPMSDHTTFRVGGPADCWLRPDGEGFTGFCTSLLNSAKKAKVPVFILGGGSNIVVSDKGIRGIVIDLGAWIGESVWALCANEDEFIVKSGTFIDEAADYAAAAGLRGFDFLAGMPGTVGGAVWMNARCYGSEVADILSWVELIDYDQNEYSIKRIDTVKDSGFGYKRSPFQKMDCLIISAAFKLHKGDKEEILSDMENKRQDRQDKGHYLYPCAGSAFKNNHDYGKTTGIIIDELGLRGLSKGEAQIAPFHGNIIINKGKATASDIRCLMDDVAIRVKEASGFILEPEILFIGDWS